VVPVRVTGTTVAEIVPVIVMGPPVRPQPVLTLVTCASAALVHIRRIATESNLTIRTMDSLHRKFFELFMRIS
jgi:hypothetical protein